MKIIAGFCFLLCFHFCYSQEIPPDLLKKMEETGQNKVFRDSLNQDEILTVKKGELILSNGIFTKYSDLTIIGDSVSFLDSAKVRFNCTLADIYWIKRYHRQPGRGALAGTTLGLFSGVIVGFLAYPENNFLETLLKMLFPNEEEEPPHLSKKAIPLIAGFTAGGAVIGTLAGLATVKEEFVIDHSVSVSFAPEIFSSYAYQPGIMLKAIIRF
jgi:hypothetical protein